MMIIKKIKLFHQIKLDEECLLIASKKSVHSTAHSQEVSRNWVRNRQMKSLDLNSAYRGLV